MIIEDRGGHKVTTLSVHANCPSQLFQFSLANSYDWHTVYTLPPLINKFNLGGLDICPPPQMRRSTKVKP